VNMSKLKPGIPIVIKILYFANCLLVPFGFATILAVTIPLDSQFLGLSLVAVLKCLPFLFFAMRIAIWLLKSKVTLPLTLAGIGTRLLQALCLLIAVKLIIYAAWIFRSGPAETQTQLLVVETFMGLAVAGFSSFCFFYIEIGDLFLRWLRATPKVVSTREQP